MKFNNFALSLLLLLCMACEDQPEFSPDPLPFQFVREEVFLNLPSNNQLQLQKWMYLEDAGLRGIIVYKETDRVYKAFERNCPYNWRDSCATVNMHSSMFYMECQCDDETHHFDFNGWPTRNAGRYKLREYFTTLDQGILYITSDGP